MESKDSMHITEIIFSREQSQYPRARYSREKKKVYYLFFSGFVVEPDNTKFWTDPQHYFIGLLHSQLFTFPFNCTDFIFTSSLSCSFITIIPLPLTLPLPLSSLHHSVLLLFPQSIFRLHRAVRYSLLFVSNSLPNI